MKRIGKLCILALALVFLLGLLPGGALAADIVDSGTCGTEGDNLTWTLNSDGVLTISGTGAMSDYSTSNQPWDVNSIRRLEIQNGVKRIGSYAFYGCNSLTGIIDLPSSLISIASYAFYGCSGLTSVTIPKNVTGIGEGTFAACSSLTSFELEYGNHAFICIDGVLLNREDKYSQIDRTELIACPAGKQGTVTIPASVTHIRGHAFEGCSSLTSITIPSSVMYIEGYAFSGCSGLTNVTIPSSVTSIGSFAFKGCSSLTSVTIPASVTSIGSSAFRGCSCLTNAGPIGSGCSIEFGWTEQIPNNAFSGCSGLTNVTIPNSVTSIGAGAFHGCSGLTSINVDSANAAYCSINGILYDKEKTMLICCPAGKTGAITIPEGVTSIGDSACDFCSALTSVTIPNSVTSIGSYAFSGCSSLMQVALPTGLTSLGVYAFRNCNALTSRSRRA